MHFEPILAGHPTIVVLVLATAAVLVALKMFMRVVERRLAQTAEGLLDRFQELENTVEQIRAVISEPAAASARLHGHNRSRAIALIEQGDRLESVAAEFGAPVSEIELLMKVHRLLARQSA